MDIDRAIEGVTLLARLAAALGAMGLPGEALLAELERVLPYRRGPLELYTEAGLDELGWALPVHPLALLQGAEHLPLDHALVHRLLDELRPEQVLLRVGPEGARVEFACTRWPAALREAPTTREILGVRIGGNELAVRVPCPDAFDLERLCRPVCSEPQARWQRAMREALSARATVWLEPGRTTVSYERVPMETVLRTLLHLDVPERVPRVLGALAGAADTEHARLELGSHAGEPPIVGVGLTR